MRSILSLILAIPYFCFSAASVAQEADKPAADPTAVKTESQIQAYIDMLDSPRYRDRAQASSRLGRMGVSAIEALERVAAMGAAEASGRAFDILKRHSASEDPILKAAAADALGRIAEQADHPKSEAAERLLNPVEPTPKTTPRIQLRQLPPRPLIANRRIQIRIKIADGAKDITIDENGKKIRFIEDADGIEVERSDGKGGTLKTKFKNREELKEKDAEAYKALQHAPKMPNIGIRFPPAGPAAPGALKPMLPEDILKRHEEILKQHQDLRKRHEELHERLRRMQPDVPPPLGEPIKVETTETIDV